MKWINSNERRPDEIGDYYAEDSKGEKTLAPFVNGNWLSDTGHPIAKWLDESQASDKDKEIADLKHAVDSFESMAKEFKEEKDYFAISFACWLKGAEGQMYEATGMSAQALLDKYKDRPFINTFDTDKQ